MISNDSHDLVGSILRVLGEDDDGSARERISKILCSSGIHQIQPIESAKNRFLLSSENEHLEDWVSLCDSVREVKEAFGCYKGKDQFKIVVKRWSQLCSDYVELEELIGLRGVMETELAIDVLEECAHLCVTVEQANKIHCIVWNEKARHIMFKRKFQIIEKEIKEAVTFKEAEHALLWCFAMPGRLRRKAEIRAYETAESVLDALRAGELINLVFIGDEYADEGEELKRKAFYKAINLCRSKEEIQRVEYRCRLTFEDVSEEVLEILERLFVIRAAEIAKLETSKCRVGFRRP